MLIVLNDIAFNLKYSDKYKAIKCMKQLIEVLVELRKADSGFKVCACNRLEEGELAEGYSISKLFSESEELFEKNYYSFRQHLDICYHGYRDDSMPQNLKNKLDNIE